MRRLAVAALLVAACQSGDPPSTFGVNLTVSRARVDLGRRASIRSTRLLVPDDNDFEADIESSHFHGADEARFQYVPGVRTGTLRFFVVAADANGTRVAEGQSGGAVGSACTADCACATGSCVDGRCGATSKPLGAACGAHGECESGSCVDGVCCGVASCPSCRSCGADGSCGVVVMRAIDPGSCEGAMACDATGACKKANGQSCAGGGECASGACIDGYCCNDATCGGCRRCDAAGMEGTCTAVPDGTDPRGACAAGGPRTEGGYFCLQGACATSCACPGGGTLCDNRAQDATNGTADCKKCHYCESGKCFGKVQSGMSCNYNVYCGSSFSCNMGLCGATCTP